jgi:MFS family permease
MNARSWGVLFVLCGAIFLEGIDVAMLNVALPSIRADLGLSTGMLGGVVSAYVLGYGGFILLGGRAADLLGRRRMFLFWLAVFLAFSGLGGIATEGWMLLLARFATGIAAAFMAPAGLALITANFAAGTGRTRALGFYAGTAAGGYLLGLVIGGLLVTVGWRWVFFAPVIMSALLLLAAIPLVKDSVTPPRPSLREFDLGGGLTVTGAMLLLAYAVIRLEHASDWLGTAGAFAAGLALLAAFVAIERRVPHPLVRLRILRSAPLVRTNVAALLFLGAFAGFQFLVTLYLQELRGWSPLQTGLAMLVLAIDVILAPTLTPRLVERFGNLRVLFGGLVLAVIGYLLFLPVGLDWAYTAMLPTMVVLGLAFSLAYGPLTMAATDGIDEREHGLAGGLLYTATQFGTALGLSAATAVYAAGLGDTPLDAIQSALVVPVVAVATAVVVAGLGLRRQGRAIAYP